MVFNYYDPPRVIPLIRNARITQENYKVCAGCVFMGITPPDCFHHREDFDLNFDIESIQSDRLCAHCSDTVAETQEPIHLHEDRNLPTKLAELERILKMASTQR